MTPSEYIAARLDDSAALTTIGTFREFLEKHARVKAGAHYIRYHFDGRSPLAQIVERIDRILGQRDATPAFTEELRQPESPLSRGVARSAGVCASESQISNFQSEIQTSGEHREPANGCSVTLPNLAISDASLAICGGAQFGKTVLMLNLLVYLTAVRFRNVGYYLPDDDLVQGIVDGKLRPDVLDQIPAVAKLIQLGKTLNATGRAVHRKGALLITDGERTALAYLRGMGKVPTTFSMDVVIQDEKDDIAEYNAKFLAGRMTASDLRFSLSIGTQRYHGAGQNKEFEDGTQHVGVLFAQNAGDGRPEAGGGSSQSEISNFKSEIFPPLGLLPPDSSLPLGLCPEEHWPQICRLSLTGTPHSTDPQLTPEGDFLSPSGEHIAVSAMREPCALVYLADPISGTPLDRRNVQFIARRPDREAQRKWSYRVSQLIIDAIDLKQIIAAWELAVRDPEQTTAFCTDRLAMPRSLAQGLDPATLQRARETQPYTLFLTPSSSPNVLRYAGLDMGDRCWLTVTETSTAKVGQPESPLSRGVARSDGVCASEIPHFSSEISNLKSEINPPSRLIWAEMISAERVRQRVPELCAALGVRVLAVDAGPLRDLSRDLCFQLAGKTQRWDEAAATWRDLRACAVEFTLREGQGIRHKAGITQDGAVYPLIACHREETIARVIEALKHPAAPRFLLPERHAQTAPILTTYEQHLLAGSRQERATDGKSLHYVDHCENHFLLATAYAFLAQRLDTRAAETTTPGFTRIAQPRTRRTVEG